jgi:DNA-binding transcriptional regulator YhcF (GntR family)
MCLLARPAPEGQGTRIAVPRLSDMAEITNLTPETVSRTLSELRRQGEIERTNREMALLHIDSTAWAA